MGDRFIGPGVEGMGTAKSAFSPPPPSIVDLISCKGFSHVESLLEIWWGHNYLIRTYPETGSELQFCV